MRFDEQKIKEKLKELLKAKLMIAKETNKKFTVADVYQEAGNMLRDELKGIKGRELSKTDELKMAKLGKLLSKMVLKEMKVI